MAKKADVIIVASRYGRSPFQVFLMGLCIYAGIKSLMGWGEVSATLERLPAFYTKFWGSSLLLGAIMSLIGAFWKGKTSTGMFIERTGLWALGGAAIIYSLVLIGYVGTSATASIITTLGFGLFCFRQVKYINKIVALYIEKLKDNGNASI